MVSKKIRKIDKGRAYSKYKLRESGEPLSLKIGAHRSTGKQFNRLDHTRGSLLAKQPRTPERVTNPNDRVLQELAEIRELKRVQNKKGE